MGLIELNDDELFAIDRIQTEIQNKYTGRELDLTLISGMREDIKERFLKLGLLVNVSFESHGKQLLPAIEIQGRVGPMADYLAKETDHERKRFDAIRRPGSELRKLTNQIKLLE